MDKIPLNFSLLGNPWNWIIILLMVYIVGLAIAAILGTNFLPSAKFTAQSGAGGY